MTILNQPKRDKLGEKLKELLNLSGNNRFDNLYILVAYVKKSGVMQLKENLIHFRDNGGKVKCVAGIDQKNSSIEGITSLFELTDELFLYHSEYITQTFHPKIYLFEKENDKAVAFIGSNNLTEGGLFTNYEACYSINLDLHLEKDRSEFLQIKDVFNGYSDTSLPCCKKVNQAFLRKIIDNNYITSESNLARQIKKTAIDYEKRKEKVFGSEIFRVARPREQAPRTRDEINEEEIISMTPLQIPDSFQNKGTILWKKQLSDSDAQNVSGVTNITGVLRFSQAKFKVGQNLINHKTYFIDEVFKMLDWGVAQRRNKQPLLVTSARFQINILGSYKGEYELKISHDTERIAGQDNVPTTLHWGDAISLIKGKHLTGKILSLYSPATNDSEPFYIEIN